jgi:glycosyltransferase involved in cell wall biosynthesis
MKAPVLYLSYTGLLEPLGQSQVLAYLEVLAKDHVITLVTFEKAADLADIDAIKAMQVRCRHSAIEWLPRRYHQRPRLLATLYDLVVMTVLALRYARRGAVLIHCRGYITATAAWLTQRWTRVPFLFDMRALWLDEMQVAGRLRSGSLLARVLRRLERQLLRDAVAVVSLTEAAVEHLRSRDRTLENQTWVVIPTCVQTRRFTDVERGPGRADEVRLGSVGSVASGWFPVDALVGVFAALQTAVANSRLLVTTRDDPGDLLARLDAIAVSPERVQVSACTPEQIPERMAQLDAGFCVFAGTGIAKLGSMPTRMGEFLASGVPVIGNFGVGDVAALIERHRIGVVLKSFDQAGYQNAVSELLVLLRQPDLAQRCRTVAIDHFSLALGVERYARIYCDSASKTRRAIESGALR